ncbi:MAG: carbohydrate ABC transporter permease [Clostridiales bacterium]|jgi:multiple sugar transport system permease protein|nr:carbohydrate ABC transporter permease [Clostridiales bacterium]
MKSSKLATKTGIISAMDLKRTSTRVFYRFLFAFCILMVLICLLPPLYVMLSSLKSVQEFYSIPPTIIPRTFEPYKIIDVWVKTNFGRHYINSLIMIAGCVASALVFNGMAGYTLAILKPRGYKIGFAVIMWSLMMPTVINIVPVMVNLTKIGLINSFLPLWLGYGANAFQVMLFKSFFESLPVSLVEAARMDGCTSLKIFTRIILPMSKPITMVIAVLTVNSSWSDFLMPYLVLKDKNLMTVMVKIYDMANSHFPKDYQMVALLFAIVPPAIIFIFFSKYFTQGVSIGSVKG